MYLLLFLISSWVLDIRLAIWCYKVLRAHADEEVEGLGIERTSLHEQALRRGRDGLLWGLSSFCATSAGPVA